MKWGRDFWMFCDNGLWRIAFRSYIKKGWELTHVATNQEIAMHEALLKAHRRLVDDSLEYCCCEGRCTCKQAVERVYPTRPPKWFTDWRRR